MSCPQQTQAQSLGVKYSDDSSLRNSTAKIKKKEMELT